MSYLTPPLKPYAYIPEPQEYYTRCEDLATSCEYMSLAELMEAAERLSKNGDLNLIKVDIIEDHREETKQIRLYEECRELNPKYAEQMAAYKVAKAAFEAEIAQWHLDMAKYEKAMTAIRETEERALLARLKEKYGEK